MWAQVDTSLWPHRLLTPRRRVWAERGHRKSRVQGSSLLAQVEDWCWQGAKSGCVHVGSQRWIRSGRESWEIKLNVYLGLNEDGTELQAIEIAFVSMDAEEAAWTWGPRARVTPLIPHLGMLSPALGDSQGLLPASATSFTSGSLRFSFAVRTGPSGEHCPEPHPHPDWVVLPLASWSPWGFLHQGAYPTDPASPQQHRDFSNQSSPPAPPNAGKGRKLLQEIQGRWT